jgi:hypothetical protein
MRGRKGYQCQKDYNRLAYLTRMEKATRLSDAPEESPWHVPRGDAEVAWEAAGLP